MAQKNNFLNTLAWKKFFFFNLKCFVQELRQLESAIHGNSSNRAWACVSLVISRTSTGESGEARGSILQQSAPPILRRMHTFLSSFLFYVCYMFYVTCFTLNFMCSVFYCKLCFVDYLGLTLFPCLVSLNLCVREFFSTNVCAFFN